MNLTAIMGTPSKHKSGLSSTFVHTQTKQDSWSALMDDVWEELRELAEVEKLRLALAEQAKYLDRIRWLEHQVKSLHDALSGVMERERQRLEAERRASNHYDNHWRTYDAEERQRRIEELAKRESFFNGTRPKN